MTLSKDALNDIQLLVFDLDGTLIDSKKDLALSVNAVREWKGMPRLPNETVASYVGQGVPTLIRRALANGAAGEVTEEAVQEATAFFLDYYRAHMLDNTIAYDGVREALEELNDRTLAVLTNKPVAFSRAILAGLKLADYFAFVYGGNSFEQKKPDPVGVIKLMSDTGASPRETVMVGDSDTDVLTGRNAGVWTCGVTYGLGSHTLGRVVPDVLVEDLRELPPLLNGRKQVQSPKSKVREQK
jgi:phosphoglycolate phosphatase